MADSDLSIERNLDVDPGLTLPPSAAETAKGTPTGQNTYFNLFRRPHQGVRVESEGKRRAATGSSLATFPGAR